MGDMGDAYGEHRTDQRRRKESVREYNERLLRGRGLPGAQANDGAHWMLRGVFRGDPDVDAYPGTGRWRVGGKRGRGFKDLLRALGIDWRGSDADGKDGES